MKRTCLVLCAGLLALAAPRMSAWDAETTVLRVPGDFATIQEAVTAAMPGDIISVGPGTYCESVLVTTPGIHLRAAPSAGGAQVVLSGACGIGGYGIHVSGVSGVEITGFTIEGFEAGIVLHNVTGSLVQGNEVRANFYRGSTTPGFGRANGILLNASSSNEVLQNWSHDNGHLGIGLYNASNGNLIRANRLTDNQAQQATYPGFACSLMIWGATNSGNRILENEVTGSLGMGIMIGSGSPSVQAGNVVAQNRVHGHPWEGIVVMAGGSYGNLIQNNNALGNGLAGYGDLWDSNTTNLWLHNLGTCEPGNAACQ